jgi:hypothetical protein
MCRSHVLLAALALLLPVSGCSTRYVLTDRGPQAYYQTGFPVHDTSVELERIFRSVVRLQVTGSYTTYRFALEDSITDADLRQRSTYRRATERFDFEHSKSGTAAIIGRTAQTRSRSSRTTTCSGCPTRWWSTTGIRPRRAGHRAGRRYVESVSVLTQRRDLVLGLPEVVSFRVAARDSANDIATVTATCAAVLPPTWCRCSERPRRRRLPPGLGLVRLRARLPARLHAW